MSTTPELTVLYDGSCPICRWEQRKLTAADRHGRLCFVDIQAPGFDAGVYGRDLGQLMGRLHARRTDGTWLVGWETLLACYRAVGWWWLHVPLSRVPRPLADRLYACFAAQRQRIAGLFGHCFDGACDADRCRR